MLLRLAVFLLLVALSGCVSLGRVVHEPLRVGNLDDLDPGALGLEPGVSTLAEARARLQQRALTGIVEDAYAAERGELVQVVTADYQSRVHVFVGGRYRSSLTLPTAGLPPYGMALRLARAGSSVALLVLYRNPLARREEPPALLAYRQDGSGGFALAGRATFEALVARHGGMNRPLLVGNDVADGVLLVARDSAGELWDESYLLRVGPGVAGARNVSLAAQPMTEALRCSCVRAYAAGAASY